MHMGARQLYLLRYLFRFLMTPLRKTMSFIICSSAWICQDRIRWAKNATLRFCRTEYAYATLTAGMLFSKLNFNTACLGL